MGKDLNPLGPYLSQYNGDLQVTCVIDLLIRISHTWVLVDEVIRLCGFKVHLVLLVCKPKERAVVNILCRPVSRPKLTHRIHVY